MSEPDPLFAAPPAAGLRRRTIEATLVMAAAQAVRIALQLGGQIVLARLLFPADFGLLAMVYPVIGFLQLFADSGLGQAVVQSAAPTRAQVSGLFWLNLALSAVMALVVAAVTPLAALAYHEPRVVPFLLALGAMLPLSALQVLPTALLTRQMRFRVIAAIELVASALGLGTTILLASRGWSTWALVIGQLVNMAAGVLLAWSRVRWWPGRPRRITGWREQVRFGGGLMSANLANYLIVSADTLLVGVTTSTVALGLYDRSYRLVVQPLGQLIAPLGRVALPLFARLVDRPELYRRTYLDLFSALSLATVPAMLVCVTDAATVIEVLLGPRWAAAAPIFAWICVGGLTSAVYASTPWLFISQGRTPEMARFNFAALAINLISFLIGAVWGVVGIAAAGAIGFVLLTTPLNLLSVTRRGPIARADVARATVPLVTQALATFAALHALATTGLTGLTRLLAETVLAYGLFAASALLVPGQRGILRHMRGVLRREVSAGGTGADDVLGAEQPG